jgi:hypothetical protein
MDTIRQRLEYPTLKLTSYPPAPRVSAPLSLGSGHRLAHSGRDRGNEEAQMNGVNALREQGGMTWIEDGRAWVAAPAEVLTALANDGFEECKREITTSRRDCRAAGGVWQAINPRTRSVASVIWVARPAPQAAMVFIEIDGEPITRPGRDPDEEEGGQG